MDFAGKSYDDLLNLATMSEDKDALRSMATHCGITFSGNTGVDTLREKLIQYLSDKIEEELNKEPDLDPNDPITKALKEQGSKPQVRKSAIPPVNELLQMNPRNPKYPEALKRAIVRAKAMKLIRCRVNNLDPADAQVPGAIITCYNKYTGKISKYVPFGEENELGYHLPQIIFDELQSRQFPMRKEIKTKGSSFGVKQYKTTMQKKFSLEVLPALTKDDLDNLANDQKARGAIDQTV